MPRPLLRTATLLTTLLTALLTVLLTALTAQNATGQESPTQRSQLLNVPEVSLPAAEEAVRDQLADQREQLNAALESEALSDDQLGQAFGALGQVYLLYDLTEAADACFRNAQQLEPANPRWPYLLGNIYQLDGRLDEAAESFESVRALAGDDAPTVMRLAEVELRRQSLERAAQLYTLTLEQPGFEAASHYGLGRVALESGDAEQAARELARALELQPEANIVHYHLGVAYRELGDNDKARFHLENRGENEVRSPDPIARETQELAGGAGAMLMLGRLSLGVGATDVAEERFRKALEIDPGSAEALKSLASLQQRQGRIDAALARYEQAIALEPDDAGLRYHVARMINDTVIVGEDPAQARERRTEWDDKAIEHLQESLRIAPDFVAGWMMLAEIQERQGDLEAAQQSLATGLEIRPDAFDLYFLRAKVLARLGRRDQGIDALGRFDEALAKTGKPLADSVQVERGQLLVALGDTQRGLEELQRLAQEDRVAAGVRAEAYFHLGNHLADAGDPQAATEQYLAALALDPQLAMAHYNLGLLLGKLGQYRESAMAHASAVEADPQNHGARYAEAMALVLVGDYVLARQRLEKALEIFPSLPGYAHLLTRILVAAPADEVRDAEIGLDLAFRLFQAIPSTDHGETVAMALAESGHFDKAIEWQQRVVEELDKNGQQELAIQARERLEVYSRGEPVRSPWLSTPKAESP